MRGNLLGRNDAALNLDWLARRLAIAACQILLRTGRCRVCVRGGFPTGSNFNREFRRITEMAPLEWRKRSADHY